MVISDLNTETLGRLEEADPPVFWNLVGEVYPQTVDGMFEATLITGTVQSVNNRVDIAAETTYFTLPKGAFGPLRMRAPYPIRKVSLAGLDMMNPSWQRATPGKQIQAWFPLGVSGFGIFPQLASDAQVVMDWIVSPINVPRPYTGAETIPFPVQFADAFSEYAAALCRAKEGGAEAEEASTVYEEYFNNMKALSLWQTRLDSLVLSKAYGGNVETNPRSSV